jgi:hypothetical protein
LLPLPITVTDTAAATATATTTAMPTEITMLPQQQQNTDKVTSEGLLETDIMGNLDVVDLIRQKDVTGKEAIKCIKKKMLHKNPNVVIHALNLLEMVVKNCGAPVHAEIATQPFLKDFKRLIESAPRGVKTKALECIQEVRDQPYAYPSSCSPRHLVQSSRVSNLS